jgi:sulfur carrier protein
MRVTLNGTPVDTDASTLAGLLGDLPDGHAAAVNGEVVPRSAHAAHPLAAGDVVEVVTAVAGG